MIWYSTAIFMNLLFKIIPAIASAVTLNLLSRWFLTIKLWYFVLSRKFFDFGNDFPINITYNGKQITYYLRHVMDVAVLREVYVNKEYEWFPVSEPKVIVDLGAHFGDTTLYYHAHFPNATIIAVEPAPDNFARLQKHVAGIKNIVCVNAAVGSVDGTITLNLGVSSLGHSVIKRHESDIAVEVPLLTLLSVLGRAGVEKADLIKFDIEGAEFDLFTNESLVVHHTKALIGEVHLDLSAGKNLNDFLEKFSTFNSKVSEISHDKRYVVRLVNNSK